jgi:peptide/nickel transport system substrate-binding protein
MRPLRPARRLVLVSLVLAVLWPAGAGSVAAAPEGTLTIAMHFTPVTRWLDPAEGESTITPYLLLYTLHDGLLKPMPGFGSAPNRVRFVFKEPWPDFPAFFGTFVASAGWVVPKKYLERVGDEGFRKAPIGADLAMLLTGPTAQDIERTPGMRLVAPLLVVFWLDFPDQWNPKSPWADKRVRLAASLAIDRQALNEAETIGLSRPMGSTVPPSFEFALPFEPPPFDPARAKKLLAEAGYPKGFDAGELTPFPPYNAMGETIQGWLQAIGIRTRMRAMERGAFMTAWRDTKLTGVVLTISGVSGNAATRLESFVTRNGAFAYGALPEVDDLFRRQARELDRKKREALLHQIQRILHEQVVQAPIYHLGFPIGVGPRVDDIMATAIPGFYMSPYEDLKLRRQ